MAEQTALVTERQDPREVTTTHERTTTGDQLTRDATAQRLCETAEHIDFFWEGPGVGARDARIFNRTCKITERCV